MSIVATPPKVVQEARARLGEGPVWDERTRSLFWVDIYNHRVHQFFPERGSGRVFEVGDTVGSLALTEGDTLLVALRHQIARLSLVTGQLERLVGIDEDRPKNRLNDGKVDPQGRFWVGSMSREAGQGALYRYDPDGSLHRMEDGVTIPNGPAWSPDGGTMYFAHSDAATIYAYDFDGERGELSQRRVFAKLGQDETAPDGMTVDEEGYVWSAQWDGHGLLRLAADGSIADRLDLPVKRPTSCAFGGPERKHLYITSASVELSEEEIEANFHSGDLFCATMNIRGLPFGRFAG
jgi:sugar lactone lactonase YvrE